MGELATVLLLILTANGTPVLAQHLPVLHKHTYPLDAQRTFIDGRRVLGESKTWRGLLAALFCTPIIAIVLGVDWYAGMLVALLAMLGDCLSSFIKRRIGLAPGAMLPGLDQIPESLFPALYWKLYAGLPWPELGLLVIIFFVLELILSRLLYHLGIRKHPY